MNLRRSLGKRKFDAILSASILEMVIDVMMSMIDTAVTGHIVGTVGLSAMNIVAPITGFTVFTENLFSTGTSMVYARHASKYEKEKANRALGTGILMSILIGIVTALIITAVLPVYLSYMNVSETIRIQVMQFMSFIRIELAVKPLFELITAMIFIDGDEVLGTAANITETIMNIILSIILGRQMGMMGISLGSLLSTLLASGFLAAHFFKKKNTLHLQISWNTDDIKKAAYFGANDVAMFFLLPILFFLITKFIVWRFGEFYLPVLTVINCIIELTVVFEASGEAMRPILPVYLGDRNFDALKDLLKHSVVINLGLGLIFSVFLLSAGNLIPVIFDIEDPALLEICATGLRVYAIGCPAMSMAAEFNSYFLNTGRAKLALFENILNQLVTIVVLVLILGYFFGINGVWAGFAAAPYLTLMILAVTIHILVRKGIMTPPLPKNSDDTLTRTIDLDTDELMELVYSVHDFLLQRGVDEKLSYRVELALEECLTLVRDNNRKAEEGKRRKDTLAECTVRISDGGVDLSIWDTGAVIDMTDEEMPVEDLRSYVVARVLDRERTKKHRVAMSFNRNFFHFEKEENLLEKVKE